MELCQFTEVEMLTSIKEYSISVQWHKESKTILLEQQGHNGEIHWSVKDFNIPVSS